MVFYIYSFTEHLTGKWVTMLNRTATIENIRQHLRRLDDQYTEENVRVIAAAYHLEDIALDDTTYADNAAHKVQQIAQQYYIISDAARVHLAVHDGRLKLDEAEGELTPLRGRWFSKNPHNPTSVSSIFPVNAIFRISIADEEALTALESILESYPTLVRD